MRDETCHYENCSSPSRPSRNLSPLCMPRQAGIYEIQTFNSGEFARESNGHYTSIIIFSAVTKTVKVSMMGEALFGVVLLVGLTGVYSTQAGGMDTADLDAKAEAKKEAMYANVGK